MLQTRKGYKAKSIFPSHSPQHIFFFLCDIMLCIMLFYMKVASNVEANEEKREKFQQYVSNPNGNFL